MWDEGKILREKVQDKRRILLVSKFFHEINLRSTTLFVSLQT